MKNKYTKIFILTSLIGLLGACGSQNPSTHQSNSSTGLATSNTNSASGVSPNTNGVSGASPSPGGADCSGITGNPNAQLPNTVVGSSDAPLPSPETTSLYAFYAQTKVQSLADDGKTIVSATGLDINFSTNPNFCTDMNTYSVAVDGSEIDIVTLNDNLVVTASPGVAQHFTDAPLTGPGESFYCGVFGQSPDGQSSARVTTTQNSADASQLRVVLNVIEGPNVKAFQVQGVASPCPAMSGRWPVYKITADAGNGFYMCAP